MLFIFTDNSEALVFFYQEGKEGSGIFISRIAENGAAGKPGKLQLNDQVLEVCCCLFIA